MIRFGPSGNSESFYNQGFKSSVDMPKWLNEKGLTAYEYQCSKGVNISEEKAKELGKQAKQYNIFLSIHSPYFISLSSKEEEKRLKSVDYLIDTLKAASWMGAKRVVVHPGSCSGIERKFALKTAMDVMKIVLKNADEQGLGSINICPETMGKLNQLGDLDEVLEMCLLDERLIPTIDFGHLHARGLGALKSTEDFDRILDTIESKLGKERLQNFHCHFSRIEFTVNGGEKKHWTLADTQYGPEFEHFARAVKKRNLNPIIICESRGTMAEDALRMKSIYEEIC